MSRKKSKYTPQGFESLGEKYTDSTGKVRTDTTANIYESMLTSEAFLDLKTRQKMLYVLCKAQYYGKRKPGKDYPDIEQLQDAKMFYLNLNLIVQYGLYTKNMHKEFYKDMQELEKHKFIKQVVKGGGNGKTKSVWQFCDGWRTWTNKKNCLGVITNTLT